MRSPLRAIVLNTKNEYTHAHKNSSHRCIAVSLCCYLLKKIRCSVVRNTLASSLAVAVMILCCIHTSSVYNLQENHAIFTVNFGTVLCIWVQVFEFNQFSNKI